MIAVAVACQWPGGGFMFAARSPDLAGGVCRLARRLADKVQSGLDALQRLLLPAVLV